MLETIQKSGNYLAVKFKETSMGTIHISMHT